MLDLHSPVDLGEVAIWHHLVWLIAYTNLESGWAPVNELDGALGLEGGDSAMNLLRNNITTV